MEKNGVEIDKHAKGIGVGEIEAENVAVDEEEEIGQSAQKADDKHANALLHFHRRRLRRGGGKGWGFFK